MLRTGTLALCGAAVVRGLEGGVRFPSDSVRLVVASWGLCHWRAWPAMPSNCRGLLSPPGSLCNWRAWLGRGLVNPSSLGCGRGLGLPGTAVYGSVGAVARAWKL